MKRITILIILISMMAHCASRIGLLSYLYRQRHEIAYHIGVIAEIPIAMCSNAYDFSEELVIHTHESDPGLPPALPQAREIHLFFQSTELLIDCARPLTDVSHSVVVYAKKYRQPAISIFHPPA